MLFIAWWVQVIKCEMNNCCCSAKWLDVLCITRPNHTEKQKYTIWLKSLKAVKCTYIWECLREGGGSQPTYAPLMKQYCSKALKHWSWKGKECLIGLVQCIAHQMNTKKSNNSPWSECEGFQQLGAKLWDEWRPHWSVSGWTESQVNSANHHSALIR